MIILIKKILQILIVFLLFACNSNYDELERKPYAEELNAKISRGIVCFVKNDKSNFISWRKLPSDSENQTYYLWSKDLNQPNSEQKNIAQINTTHFIDSINKGHNFEYGISLNSKKIPDKFEKVVSTKISELNVFEYNLGINYKQAYVVTGDLTGDGELEILISYSEMDRVDPYKDAWLKSTDSFHLVALNRYGKRLWEFDFGFGIEAGRNYCPIVVWDLNADGKCEVILKTNKSNDPKNYEQEYISILNGENGNVIREARWPSPASSDYNSNSRNYIAIAHLDGVSPSIIVGRGVYNTQVVCSFDATLTKQWKRIIGKDLKPKFENKIFQKIWNKFSNDRSRGSHSLPIADVDENGSEEILWGDHTITQGGEDLWEIEEKIPYYGHLDIVYAANMIDSIPGKETFYCREGWGDKSDRIGMLLVDARGNTIWSKWGYTHVDGGWASKVIPGKINWQFFGYDVPKKVWTPGVHTFIDPMQHFLNSSGELISHPDSSWIGSFTVDWEGDGIKEICTISGELKRYNNELILSLNKGILWAGDILGDHREEIIYAPQDGKIYIISNTEETNVNPEIAKYFDRQYRNDLSRTAMQYNVIPTQSGYIPLLNNE